MRTFLFPPLMRRGQPTVEFVESESRLGHRNYWLGTYHDLKLRPKPARLTDYNAVSRTRVSKRFYKAFLAESKENHLVYRRRTW